MFRYSDEKIPMSDSDV